jgi:LPXTG-site transpeptidase (sortase) family protein
MYNKKKIICIIFFIVTIILLIVFYLEQKKIYSIDNNEIITEQNIVVQDITEYTEENTDDNNEQQEIIYDETEIENSNSNNYEEQPQNEEVENIESNSKIENEEISISNTNATSSLAENAFVDGHLKEYPNFGEKYATLIISKIKVNAPIYFGATDEIILQGIGHDSGSNFPGENGTIIMCEHNYMNNFKRLGELINGDIIEVQTSYGDFFYKIYDEQVVLETEKYKLPIQHDEEILMIYTCYPLNSTGYTQYRYVLYAKKYKKENKNKMKVRKMLILSSYF